MFRILPMINNSVKAFDLELGDLADGIENDRIVLRAFALAAKMGTGQHVSEEIRLF